MKDMLRNMPSKAKTTLFLLGLVAIFAVVKDGSLVVRMYIMIGDSTSFIATCSLTFSIYYYHGNNIYNV